MHSFDTVVIGGGIVGMATAMALLERSGGRRSVVVLEAEAELAQHQTGRNSGVIHSGIYYKPGSLKARLCVEGRTRMLRFCEEHDVPTELCGKVIVATDDRERAALDVLERRGVQNGVLVQRCEAGELAEREPAVSGVAALFVPGTGIVSYAAVTRAMAKVVAARGGEVRLGARVLGVTRGPSELALETAAGVVHARNIVNCAGLQCDRIALMCGMDPGIAIIPFRGEYYDLVPESRGLCKNLIYPVPDARYPFLGVHFTRAVNGTVEAGPNAVLALKREGYAKTSFAFEDAAALVTYLGFWKMASDHWATGVSEMHRSLHKATFVRSLQKLVPAIQAKDLEPGRAGVRAQAVDRDGKLADDFRLVAGEAMLHVLNAPSPAATASIAIGEHLARVAETTFRPPLRLSA
ncbi:MAG: putative oxidoreductase [Labilithrix sp.]|nr:putative oxidoreductase [Labilithrix sp.]